MKYSMYDFYKEFYDLRRLNLNISNKKILFLIYDDKYYYLNKSKFLDFNDQKHNLDLIKKVSKTYKLNIVNYYPVCYCKSTLVIALRIVADSSTKLKGVETDSVPFIYKKLVDFHKKNYEMLYLSSSVSKEIKMSQKYIGRYKFHDKFIKKYILTHKKRKREEFKELLLSMIPEKKSIIDVSCGNNNDIFEIASKKNYDVIVGNDICLNYLGGRENKDIIYTNDDAVSNQVKENAYDVVYCKNTLHHMNDISGIKNILAHLNKISNDEILIIEICNPKESGGLPRFLNKWLYVKFLKDVGDCFLNESQFRNLIKNQFSNHEIEYSTFTNILGKYMIAKIRKVK